MTRHLPLLLVTVVIAVSNIGCHRHYYRKQADGEVDLLIAEKARHVNRPPQTPYRIAVDRRSRMYNPFDLDFQPMPLDDPASYRYMQCVDGRRGYPMWEAAGITNAAESPDWWEFLPLDEDGVLVLNAENAVRIALINSPNYQFQVEQLYLSALDVSRERFQFDTQFTFGSGAEYFNRATGGDALSTSTSDVTIGPTNLGMSRLTTTGGALLANFANSIVWDLSGPDSRLTSTLVDFTFLQPLLRGAGRDIVMEQLTQAERRLLADVRSFERFRRAFFLNVTVGRGLEAQVVGGGFTAINAGAFAGGNAGGFLGLLQTQLFIRNQEENIARQAENLLLQQDTLIEQLTTIPDNVGDIIQQRLQVAQAQQSLLNAQDSLVRQQAGYKTSLDAFMRSLGLPPYICAKIEDPILDRFELIDIELLNRRKELGLVRSNVGAINLSILELTESEFDEATGVPMIKIAWTPELRELLSKLDEELRPVGDFNRKLIEEDLPVIIQDMEALAQAVPDRKRRNDSLRELYNRDKNSICSLLGVKNLDESVFDLTELDGLVEELQIAFAELEQRLQGYGSEIEALDQALETLIANGPRENDPEAIAAQLRDEIILAAQNVLQKISDDVLQLQLIQARARLESVVLPEIDISPEDAFQIARKNRRDWANVRAALVDSWRNIEVVADQLESTLDVEVRGSANTDFTRPIDFRSNTGQLRVGLIWDAPITRIIERNNYRAALIAFERAKRSYYGFEDGVYQLLRAELRQTQVNRFSFEFGRLGIRTAAAQIELNNSRRQLLEARGAVQGPTAAQDAINALNALLNAQNSLLSVFVNQEVVRRAIDFDLGTMELTPEGLWIDPGKITPDALLSLPGTTLDGLIECGCNECGLRYNPLPPEPEFGSVMQRVMHVEVADPTAAEDVSSGGMEDLPAPTGTGDEILPPPVSVDQLPGNAVPAAPIEPEPLESGPIETTPSETTPVAPLPSGVGPIENQPLGLRESGLAP